MICDKILGSLPQMDTEGRRVEFVTIEWHEAFKKIHRKFTDHGREVGIRMDDSVLKRGLHQGDVLYQDEQLIIAVHTPPCEALVVEIEKGHESCIPKVCYEIGNRHAPLFWGREENTFVTPYNEPMKKLLAGIHGTIVKKENIAFDFTRQISSAAGEHHHHEGGHIS